MKKGTGKLALEPTLSQNKVKSFLRSKYRKHKSDSTVAKYGFALAQFQTFILQKHPKQTLESILPLLSEKKIPLYPLLNGFIQYLEDQKLSPKSIIDYVGGVKSYLLFESEYEVDLTRFKDRVTLPSLNTEHEKAIDATVIRNILNSCNNRRLKAFLYLLATSGLRAMEAISLRIQDVELSARGPSVIHVRREYSKTRRPRTVFITAEATVFLKQWLDYKYRNKTRRKDHIIFSYSAESELGSIYTKLNDGFNKILETLKLDERKEGMLRRRITFHSFRRFVKTTISDQVGSDFADYILGHKRDMGYYTKTEEGNIENYKKVMSYLTFTDYSALESHGRSMEAKLEQEHIEIGETKRQFEELKMKYEMDTKQKNDQILALQDQIEHSVDTSFKRMREEHERQIRQQKAERERFLERIRVRQAQERKAREKK
jgi:integrase